MCVTFVSLLLYYLLLFLHFLQFLATTTVTYKGSSMNGFQHSTRKFLGFLFLTTHFLQKQSDFNHALLESNNAFAPSFSMHLVHIVSRLCIDKDVCLGQG